MIAKMGVLIFVLGLLVFPVQAEELNWVGCGITKKAFMAELASAYEKKTGNKITIEGGGATKGIREPAAGNADLGGTCRHRLDLPEEKGVTLHHVAWDALVGITHIDNPVNDITTAQLVKILKGEIKNWKDLGGPDMPITLFVREGKINGVGLMTRELVLKDPDFDYAADAVVKKSSGPVEIGVGETPGGFGITGVSSAKKRKNLKILKINHVSPSKGGLRAGNYVYIRPLYLVAESEPSKAVRAFVDFALSPEGQAVISAQGTVNLEEGKLCAKRYQAMHKGKYIE